MRAISDTTQTNQLITYIMLSSEYKPVALEQSYERFCDDIDFVPRGNVVIELGYRHYNLQTKQGSKLCSARKSAFKF